MIVRIKSARDGYRRCGVAHPKAATDHPADRFSAEELERLQADPVLSVELVDGELSSSSQDGGQQTSAQAASQAAKPVTKQTAKSAATPKKGASSKGGASAKPAAKDAAKPGATDAPPSGQAGKE
ncbi:HI1506-related protein [Pseudomonas alcaligenes]|uniref:HI1506-related protein n=1 Tax=Aquipseudomonas alcaligenes TaxID=43263 RepID=UPI002E7C15B3|nr:HI1506-related protein [Pseudomonas alcaligenes]MEE1950976.1 HI1506-related protein [Pseudomonas alcaligenes]